MLSCQVCAGQGNRRGCLVRGGFGSLRSQPRSGPDFSCYWRMASRLRRRATRYIESSVKKRQEENMNWPSREKQ